MREHYGFQIDLKPEYPFQKQRLFIKEHPVKSPPALYRGLACLISILGTVVANQVLLLSIGLLFLLTLLTVQGQLKKFVRFGYTVLLPIGGVLVLIQYLSWKNLGWDDQTFAAGVLHIILSVLRVALLGGIFLAAVLALSPVRLTHLLRTFGIRGRILAILVSCLNLWSDFRLRTNQVCMARCARGFMPDRSFLTRARQLPHVLGALFISALTNSLERARAWEVHGLIDRFDRLGKESPADQDCSRIAGLFLLGLSIAWSTVAFICFL